MSIRGKFTVTKISQSKWSKTDTATTTVGLSAVYDPYIPEDRSFSIATPSGSIEMYITNPAALAQLELGEVFYVDFTKVEELVTK